MNETGVQPSEALRRRRDEVLTLIDQHGARNPRVFGSVARGADTLSSDLDLLVEVSPLDAWAFVSLARELSELLGVRVDVVSDGALSAKHERLLAQARPL